MADVPPQAAQTDALPGELVVFEDGHRRVPSQAQLHLGAISIVEILSGALLESWNAALDRPTWPTVPPSKVAGLFPLGRPHLMPSHHEAP